MPKFLEEEKILCSCCGKGFFESTYQPFCTWKCKVKFEKITRNCDHCGTSFVPTNIVNKYCSTNCSKNFHMDKSRENGYEYSRFTIFSRDGFSCVYCGISPIDSKTELHVDHVFPRSSGGGNDIFNLVTACKDCNLEKSGKVLEKEVILKLWDRNKRLSDKIDLNYAKLKGDFDKVWKP